MLQGTGSDVGKSLLTAGLCRAFRNRGLSVAPFKPQNMSNNAAVTADGGEIGRAQALQARAAGLPPSRHMNPVLLKPQSDRGAQLIVQGRVAGTAEAADYRNFRQQLLAKVLESYAIIGEGRDLVVIEGAGSPAEINLRQGDIANMGFAEAAGVPVVLVGDIDRGGVIAQLVGTAEVLPEAERRRIKGFIVNKFRGDPALFEDGMRFIAERSGWPSFGLVPWLAEAAKLPAEDAVSLGSVRKPGAAIRIAIPMLPRIANFDDFDPLAAEPEVDLRFVPPGQALPGDAQLVILPGSKATLADLAFLRQQGWDIDLAAHMRRGGMVLGICGGYQMLGKRISDPRGIEGPQSAAEGLGLLDVESEIGERKTLASVTGHCLGHPVHGYEMHMGVTTGPDCRRPLIDLDGRPDGANAGPVMGCYVHGLFAADGFRRHFLGLADNGISHEGQIEGALDALAAHMEAHLDLDHLLRLARAADDL